MILGQKCSHEICLMKIRKAVFPVAGFGTRFLPATKAQWMGLCEDPLMNTKKGW